MNKLFVDSVFDFEIPRLSQDRGQQGLASSTWTHCVFVDCTFVNQYLSEAKFTNCIFVNCAFKDCHLVRAELTNCRADMLVIRWSPEIDTNFKTGFSVLGGKYIKLVVKDTAPSGASGGTKLASVEDSELDWTSETARSLSLESCKSLTASINASDILKLTLTGRTVDSSKITVRGKVRVKGSAPNLDATEANLRDSTFYEQTQFTETSSVECSVFDRADIHKCEFMKTNFRGASFVGTKGLFGPDKAELRDCINQEFASVHKFAFQPSWEDIRALGSLFVLGSSGASVVFLITYLRASQWFNEKMQLIKDDALENASNEYLQSFAIAIHPLPRPEYFKLLLISLVFLTLAGVVFRIAAPTIIHEFSLTQWERRFGLPRLEYQSASYSDLSLRWLLLIAYAVFGLIVVLYLTIRVIQAVWM